MNERKMSPKGFLHKTTTKAALAAAAFLTAHREWLTTGELAEVTTPILRKMDEREIMPTPALEEIKKVVYDHMIASEIRKGEEKIARDEAGPERSHKDWSATIYDAEGNIAIRIKEDGKEEKLTKEFDQPQEADRWVDRRLFEADSEWFGVVSSLTMKRKDGDPIASVVKRQDAIARMLKQRSGPVLDRPAKSAGKLSWGVKSRPSHARFSHG